MLSLWVSSRIQSLTDPTHKINLKVGRCSSVVEWASIQRSQGPSIDSHPTTTYPTHPLPPAHPTHFPHPSYPPHTEKQSKNTWGSISEIWATVTALSHLCSVRPSLHWYLAVVTHQLGNNISLIILTDFAFSAALNWTQNCHLDFPCLCLPFHLQYRYRWGKSSVFQYTMYSVQKRNMRASVICDTKWRLCSSGWLIRHSHSYFRIPSSRGNILDSPDEHWLREDVKRN